MITGDIDNSQGDGSHGRNDHYQPGTQQYRGQAARRPGLTLTGLALNNARGLLQSGAQLSLNTQGERLTNSDSGATGGLVARGDLLLNTGLFDGHQGVIFGKMSVSIPIGRHSATRTVNWWPVGNCSSIAVCWITARGSSSREATGNSTPTDRR
ncbi:hypothetical protein O0544_12780 [Edwardsiella anguillarum]|nr:hypothetical protein [Edwardsiella anguillarum]